MVTQSRGNERKFALNFAWAGVSPGFFDVGRSGCARAAMLGTTGRADGKARRGGREKTVTRVVNHQISDVFITAALILESLRDLNNRNMSFVVVRGRDLAYPGGLGMVAATRARAGRVACGRGRLQWMGAR